MTERDDEFSPEDDGVLEPADSLMSDDLLSDVLDAGVDAADRYAGATRFGTTSQEARLGESLDALLAEEEPELGSDQPWEDEDSPPDFDRAPYAEAGRLVSSDEGAHENSEKDLIAFSLGPAGGGLAAEEAAVHLTDEPPFRFQEA